MEIERECGSQSVRRSSLHRIDKQISISNTWFIIDPSAPFRRDKGIFVIPRDFRRSWDYSNQANRGFVYLDIRPYKHYKAKRYTLGIRLWPWQKY